MRATAGWLAATRATSLTAHEDLPGFDPAWQIYQTYHVAMSLTLSTTTPTTFNSVVMSN